MSNVNLEALFTPRSVALVGGTDSPSSVGGVLTQILLAENFGGELYIVNHRRDEVQGRPAYASVSDLPSVPVRPGGSRDSGSRGPPRDP